MHMERSGRMGLGPLWPRSSRVFSFMGIVSQSILFTGKTEGSIPSIYFRVVRVRWKAAPNIHHIYCPRMNRISSSTSSQHRTCTCLNCLYEQTPSTYRLGGKTSKSYYVCNLILTLYEVGLSRWTGGLHRRIVAGRLVRSSHIPLVVWVLWSVRRPVAPPRALLGGDG